MNNNDAFQAGLLCGAGLIILGIVVALAIWGHVTVPSVENIAAPSMYKVTIDGIEFLCRYEPAMDRDYVQLGHCNNTAASYIRIKNYSSFAVAEVE